MFYRELGVSLSQIKEIITHPNFDVIQALKRHREELLEKRQQIDLLISMWKKPLRKRKGRSL